MFRPLRYVLPALLIFTASCNEEEEPDPTDRYKGNVLPCDVVVAREAGTEPDDPQQTAIGWEASYLADREFWRSGPYPVWNTNPADACPQNPTIPLVEEQADVALYITYPARSTPTKSGKGDAAEGKWPVIVFAHANNDSQCDIFRRYFSLHDHWASWGYVVVAIDGTYTNCERGTRENLWSRTRGQIDALETLRALNADPSSRFYNHLDLDRIVMAGHSRGGGSSLLAATEVGESVRAVITLQGVDTTAFGFGAGPMLPNTPVLGITAGKDVDLDYPAVETMEDQLAGTYAWIDIIGAIHAHTADTVPIEPDDVPAITRKQQHDVTEYYTTAFLARFVGVGDGQASATLAPDLGSEAIIFTHHGQDVAKSRLSPLGIYARWNRRTGLLIDDFAGYTTTDPPERNRLGAENVCENLTRCEEVLTYKPDERNNTSARWRKAASLLLVADATGGTFRTYLNEEQSARALEATDAIKARVKGPDDGPIARFDVEVTTAQGTQRFDGHKHLGPATLTNRFTQLIIPLASLDSSEVVSIALHLKSGSLFVDDLRIEQPALGDVR
ncbi:MAG: hypothetical protein H0U74_12580 [Bradymonadaceae bacterium]|nr:hypothetical protein [Lujinxingiaceae bacterium]